MFSRVAVVKLLLAARDESKTREGIFPPSFFPSTLGFLYLNHISTPGDHFIDSVFLSYAKLDLLWRKCNMYPLQR